MTKTNLVVKPQYLWLTGIFFLGLHAHVNKQNGVGPTRVKHQRVGLYTENVHNYQDPGHKKLQDQE